MPGTDDRLRSLWGVATHRPGLSAIIVFLGISVAILEGVGLGFILPIIELAQTDGAVGASSGGLLGQFARIYEFLGVPFTLQYVVAGVAVAMLFRYSASFVMGWSRELLRADYERSLKSQAFDAALDANVTYFDREGSDEILNAIVTQAKLAGRAIMRLVFLLELGLVALVYLGIALYFAPLLTLVAVAILGSVTLFLRFVVEPGYTLGDRVADANEDVQTAVQAGTQGIRDVKLFTMADELYTNFSSSIDEYVSASVGLRRNREAINNFHQFFSAVTVFLLIYVALTFTNLTLGALGVFLFAIFRLAPRVSNLQSTVYDLQGDLPHLVRTRRFIGELRSHQEPAEGASPVDSPLERFTFEDVCFSYDGSEQVLDGVSFEVEVGDFIGFVGQSGAGKSTIISLLARLYEPDSGQILADGTPIDEFDVQAYRSRLSVVRQDPYMFSDTLRYNVTIGNRNATHEELERVCEIAHVTEFLDDLPEGYDTLLGDDGVRLSGGQKQRVALARALLSEADVLLLDEATSDLDSGIETRVQQSIEAMDREYAIITVAHRLSTVKNADRIYTVEEGNITESGSHEELVGRNGKYAELYSTQVEV